VFVKKELKHVDDMEFVDISKFRKEGYLQELNRQFLHPLGMSLIVSIDNDTGKESILGIEDGRSDPKGMFYDFKNYDDDRKTTALKNEVYVETQRRKIYKCRDKDVKYGVESISGMANKKIRYPYDWDFSNLSNIVGHLRKLDIVTFIDDHKCYKIIGIRHCEKSLAVYHLCNIDKISSKAIDIVNKIIVDECRDTAILNIKHQYLYVQLIAKSYLEFGPLEPNFDIRCILNRININKSWHPKL
jgi:hypothetical protein